MTRIIRECSPGRKARRSQHEPNEETQTVRSLFLSLYALHVENAIRSDFQRWIGLFCPVGAARGSRVFLKKMNEVKGRSMKSIINDVLIMLSVASTGTLAHARTRNENIVKDFIQILMRRKIPAEAPVCLGLRPLVEDGGGLKQAGSRTPVSLEWLIRRVVPLPRCVTADRQAVYDNKCR